MKNVIEIRVSQLSKITADSETITVFKQGANIKLYNYVSFLNFVN